MRRVLLDRAVQLLLKVLLKKNPVRVDAVAPVQAVLHDVVQRARVLDLVEPQDNEAVAKELLRILLNLQTHTHPKHAARAEQKIG